MKVQVSLTAMVKDIVVWPALTIVLGVALAYMVKRYAGVLRVTWALRAQVADLDGEFRAAQAQFERDTAGQSFGKYSIVQDLKTRRDSVLAALSGIERSVASTLDSTNSNYQNAVATVQSLQSGVGLWQGLGGQMADLSAGLERLEGRLNGADQEPPVTQGDKPAFVSTARDLLNGKTIAVSAVTAISQNAATLGALAKLWLAVRDRAAGLTAEYRRLRAQTGLPAPQVANLGTAIVSMWVHVLGVQDAAGLNGLLMNGADLDQCTVQIEQLKEIAGSEGRALGLTSAMFSAMSSVQAGEDPVDALVRAGTEAPGENRQAEFLRTQDRGGGCGFSGVLMRGRASDRTESVLSGEGIRDQCRLCIGLCLGGGDERGAGVDHSDDRPIHVDETDGVRLCDFAAGSIGNAGRVSAGPRSRIRYTLFRAGYRRF